MLLTVTLWVIYYVIFVGGIFTIALLLSFKHTVFSIVMALVLLVVGLVATFYPVMLLANRNDCSSNETKISKQVGRNHISKCVPDEELSFIFK